MGRTTADRSHDLPALLKSNGRLQGLLYMDLHGSRFSGTLQAKAQRKGAGA